MKNIGLEELKSIQLDILQAIDTFCTENGIVYSLACGTLLGAVRHKGYIPWDDDIDIYLLREDYNKLNSVFPVLYENRYQLISLERDPSWDRPYAKAFDNRTLLVEKANYSVEIGVNIDVYPIDEVPDDEISWRKYDRKRRFLQRIYAAKTIRINRTRGFAKNILLLLMKVTTLFFSRKALAKLLDGYSQKYNNKGYGSVFECVQGMLQRNRFDKRLFLEVVDMPFEDRWFKGFKRYDEYLRHAYGDYMALPPVGKRVSHHSFCAYWR